MKKRVFLFVLDSFGIGEAPDAAAFGDAGANTIASVATSDKFQVPNMAKLGLFNLDGVACGQPVEAVSGGCARLHELSMGKDTTIGHWEIAGIYSPRPLPAGGRKCLCNKPYSGTQVLVDYGMEHMETGALIVYTSADSVFQVAANEALVPVQQLYEYCQIARNMLTGELGVGRVIARPFVGDSPETFKRTANRHDFSLDPPAETMLTVLERNGLATISVGKIFDIFNGANVSESNRTTGNDHGMQVALEMLDRDFEGLCFINLVEFDMTYGHRRNIPGYAQALTDFDRFLDKFLPAMGPEDVLMITADHGCDPGFLKTTDHTREYVRWLVYGAPVKAGVNLGTIDGFTAIAGTVCEYLGVETDLRKASCWDKLKA